jgi:hypothetical protein
MMALSRAQLDKTIVDARKERIGIACDAGHHIDELEWQPRFSRGVDCRTVSSIDAAPSSPCI